MKKLFSAALSLLVFFTGCSLFRSSTQSVSVNTEPSGAKVLVNGTQYVTPARVDVRRDRSLNVVITKSGYDTISTNTGTHLNTTGILDIIGTVLFLVPVFGIVSAGAYDLDQTNFFFELNAK